MKKLIVALLLLTTTLTQATIKVAFFGDSNTVGQNNNGYIPGGYRCLLEQRVPFISVGSSSSNPASGEAQVLHDGYSGYQVDAGNGRSGLRDKLPYIFGGVRPDICILWAGLNDCITGYSLIDLPERIVSLAAQVRVSWGCRVLVLSIPSSLDQTVRERTEMANKRLSYLLPATKYANQAIEFVSLSIPNTSFVDTWHYNLAGFTQVADRLVGILK